MIDFEGIVRKYKPRGWKIRFRTYGEEGLDGLCRYDTKTITAPHIVSRYTLYTYLHECGHAHLRHWQKTRAGWVQPGSVAKGEYEAERWAMNAMRQEGIAVPKSVLAEAKRYVRECIDKSPVPVEAHIKRWAGWKKEAEK